MAAEDASAAAASLAAVPGVSKVISASGAQFKGGVAENMAPLLKARLGTVDMIKKNTIFPLHSNWLKTYTSIQF